MSKLTSKTRVEYKYTIKNEDGLPVYESSSDEFESAVINANNEVSEFIEETGEYHSAENYCSCGTDLQVRSNANE